MEADPAPVGAEALADGDEVKAVAPGTGELAEPVGPRPPMVTSLDSASTVAVVTASASPRRNAPTRVRVSEVVTLSANVRTNAPKCLARAKDCAAALTVYKEAWKLDPLMPEASRNLNEQALRVGFDTVIGGEGICPKAAAKAEWEKMLEKQ